MIVVGHQPQYIPYLGFFNKASKADKFVFVDNVQYQRRSWQNRTLISGSNETELRLSIPVKSKGSRFQDIKDVQIENPFWINKHLKSIRSAYRDTKGFEEVFDRIECHYKESAIYLIDITIPLTKEIFNILEINVPIYLSSTLGITGKKTELLVDICNKTNADTYLSGSGARQYVDVGIMQESGLQHYYNNFNHPQYKQKTSRFFEGMAVIDLLFNEGIEEARNIFWENVKLGSPYETE